MNKSYRIITEVDTNADKHLKIKLEQEYDSFQILSLNIDQKDVYENFNCDYGVVIGRVTANGGIGVPNVRVSIFIPITDDDSLRPEIKALYPYESPRQKNSAGKRYNLLPRVAQEQVDGKVRPKQPFGTFPTKQEFLTNDRWLEVYETYYKYSTITNDSGDYMLFGVPVGTQTVHISVDVTDIGRYSMTPPTMVTNLGYSPNLFVDNGTKIKESSDLDDLPNIETQEIAIDVIPFCGDSDNFDIGITRQDFRIRAELVATFTLFGSSFTDGNNHMWSEDFNPDQPRSVREYYRARNSYETPSIATKRTGKITEKVYVINNNISDDDAENGNFNPSTDVIPLDNTQYVRFIRDGDFIYQIPCNRRKIVTGEDGSDVVVSNDSTNGVFSEFRGFVVFELEDTEAPMNFSTTLGRNLPITPFRFKFKFPQNALRNEGFSFDDDNNTDEWRKQHYKFELNKYYSVAKFQGTVYNNNVDDDAQVKFNGFSTQDSLNRAGLDPFWNTNTIITQTVDTTGEAQEEDRFLIDNAVFEFPSNSTTDNGLETFGGNWINLAIHFPQFGYGSNRIDRVKNYKTATNFTKPIKEEDYPTDFGAAVDFYFSNNLQEIGGGDINTKFFARSDLHYTDFIEVPVQDVLKMKDNISTKGFKLSDIPTLIGNYKNGEDPCPENGGKQGSIPTNPVDTNTYFYKGLGSANCIVYLEELGLI